MANVKISNLTAASTPLAGTEVLPVVQSGTTVKASIANVQTATYSGGTANGVAYLNGSKVLTTGSALVFDGTTFTVTKPTAYNTRFAFDGSNYTEIGYGGTNTVAPSNPFYYFNLNGSEQMRLTSTGLGVGTSSPRAKLDVNGGAILGTGQNLSWGNVYGAGIPVISGSSSGLDFYPSGSTAGLSARLDSNGNLLVGVTSAFSSGKVCVQVANGATQNGITIQDNGSSGFAYIGFSNGSGSTIGSVSRVGTTSAVVYNTTSDQRLKSNIEDAAPVLEKIMQVQVRQYDWTDGCLHQDYGFIAQELDPLLSGVVTKGKTEEDMWQLDYSKLTPHLLKAIQEQQALIQTLTARITALESA